MKTQENSQTSECLKYSVAACQTDQPNPNHRSEMKRNTDRMLQMIDQAVIGYAPFLPVKLVVFPEFAHAAPVYLTSRELRAKLAVPIPNEHTERMRTKAREYGLYIQTGTMLENDPQWPHAVFNTTCLIGPEGLLYKYRKVNPWIPWEVHTSPHDLEAYDEQLFPVARTPIGNIGAAICYDWLFPETLRQLTANGAEVLIRVSAYMDPFGTTEPMDWWTLVNRCRALENTAYVVAANQGASLKHYPPFSWPGGSMVVDYDGRIITQASPGPGERIVVAPVNVDMLRHERRVRRAHQMMAHLRTECYPLYRQSYFPPATLTHHEVLTVTDQERQIDAVKEKIGYLVKEESSSLLSIQRLIDLSKEKGVD
jgi:formamidase